MRGEKEMTGFERRFQEDTNNSTLGKNAQLLKNKDVVFFNMTNNLFGV